MGIIQWYRRRRLLGNGLIGQEVWADLLEQHPLLARLDRDELDRLRGLATIFAAEKTFEAAGGIELTDFMRWIIAAQACLPVLELGLDWYQDWTTVVVVPREFTRSMSDTDRAGVVHEWEDEMGGEVYDRGPVVLSWADVEASGWGDGYNVIIHEAAHKLDLLDGEMNGRPPLHRGDSIEEWNAVFAGALAELKRTVQRRKKAPIDSYAAESEVEFFAVASEHFFERPLGLRRAYPEVYRLLAGFYKIDPGAG